MRIIVAEASPLYSAGLCQLLRQMEINASVNCVVQFDSLLEEINRNRSEAVLVIADSRLPGLYDTQQLKLLINNFSDRILMLSEHKDQALIRHLMFTGVRGVIAKTAALDELENAIMTVMEGRMWRAESELREEPLQDQETRIGYALRRLSNQENNVLRHVRTGLRNKQIAFEMELTEHTIKTHMSNILRKLEIENRTQLVVAIQNIELEQAPRAVA